MYIHSNIYVFEAFSYYFPLCISLHFDTLIFNFLHYFMCMGVWPVYISVCHMHACIGRDQKRVLEPLELELMMVMSYYVGAGN